MVARSHLGASIDPCMEPTRLVPGVPPCKHRSIVRDGWCEHAFDHKGADQPGINKLSEEDLATLYAILRKGRKALPAA